MNRKSLLGAAALTAMLMMTTAPVAFANAAPDPHRSVSPAPDHQNLTIYPSFGIIQQTNPVDLTQGLNSIRLDGIAGRYEPSSLVVISANGVQIKLKDVSYQPASLNLQNLLAAAVGTSITVRTADGVEHTGELRSYNDGNLVLLPAAGTPVGTGSVSGGLLSLKDPKDVQFSSMPVTLSSSPSLTLNGESPFAAHGDLQILYKANGLKWAGRYAITYNEQRGTIDISCSVAITNESGANYTNAGIKVVSGNIQEPREFSGRSFSPQAAMAAPGGGISSDDASVGSLGEQKIYSLANGGVDLRDGETKQVPLYSKDSVPVDRVFYVQNPHAGGNYPVSTSVRLVTTNDAAHRLGQSLPVGNARYFQADPAGQMQLSAAGQVKATEPGEKLLLEMGTSGDVKGQYSLVGNTPAPRNANGSVANGAVSEYKWQLSLHNYKDRDVDVKVYETGGGVRVVNASSQFKPEGGQQFTWVHVPAHGDATVTYTTQEPQQ